MMPFESFPLIKPNEDVESANHNDWSDQEADDLFNAPLEQVISQMRFKDSKFVCLFVNYINTNLYLLSQVKGYREQSALQQLFIFH